MTPTHTGTSHPLHPLTAEETQAAARIVRADRELAPTFRFVAITLREPRKQDVLAWDGTTELDRLALVELYDRASKAIHRALVDLTQHAVIEWTTVPDAQPPFLLEEYDEIVAVVQADARWQAALRKRGVTDLALAHVDPWPAGYLEPGDGPERRLSRPLTWVRADALDLPYARPVEGLTTLVDIDAMEVLEVVDHGVVPLPEHSGNYRPESMFTEANRPAFDGPRTDVKPLEVTQPDGPSFELDGHSLTWQKWQLQVGWTLREGLVLSDVRYEDGGTLRPVLFRASLSEMAVPYASPAPIHVRKAAFDAGEYGLGTIALSLENGCDCLGEIRYLGGVLHDQDANAFELPNVICIHEEDVGLAWKHLDRTAGYTEVRRLRRLVISSMVNVGNYEYMFYWSLYQDGTIELEVKLTGVLSTGALAPGEESPHGVTVAPGLYAPHHQHFFCVRLDMAVDGIENTVEEVNSEPIPLDAESNPYGNVWVTRATPLRSEAEAQRNLNLQTNRFWRVTNPNRINGLGQSVAFRLEPGANSPVYHDAGSPILQRMGFVRSHLWVTPFAPEELFAAGTYPNQNPGPDGLARWTQSDREVENTDLVVWYTFGSHHVARVEDWPVMPVSPIGFRLKPDGFFDGNPALDLPRPAAHACSAADSADAS